MSERWTRRLTVVAATVACFTLAACNTSPAPTPTPTPPAASDVVANARDVMSRQTLRGGFAQDPTNLEASFTYAPGRMLLHDLGGESMPYMLFTSNRVHLSSNGERWLSSDQQDAGYTAFYGTYFDPRTVLENLTNPTVAGDETIAGRPQHVIDASLDGDAILAGVPQPQPSIRFSVNFPLPRSADSQGLERLGYEVHVARGEDFATTAARKDQYLISIDEHAPRPGAPIEEWTTRFSGTVDGVSELNPDVKQTLALALEAYGASGDLADQIGARSDSIDDLADLRDMLNAMQARLWTDAETNTVTRMSWTDPSGGAGETSLSFWDYGASVSIPEPQPSMEFRWSDALDRIANPFSSLSALVQHHHEQTGEYPDDLSPSLLAQHDDFDPGYPFTWPVNPFTGEPTRNNPGNPGDFEYVNLGSDYELRTFGWDGVMTSHIGMRPDEPPRPSPTPSPSQALDSAATLGFPIYWLGETTDLGSDTYGDLGVSYAAACPANRSCVWPVLARYAGVGTSDNWVLSLYERPRLPGERPCHLDEPPCLDEAPVGETISIGDETATLSFEEAESMRGFTVLQAYVYLPDTVVRISPTVRVSTSAEPEGPFTSETALRTAAQALTKR